jgi:hypothetical protein
MKKQALAAAAALALLPARVDSFVPSLHQRLNPNSASNTRGPGRHQQRELCARRQQRELCVRACETSGRPRQSAVGSSSALCLRNDRAVKECVHMNHDCQWSHGSASCSGSRPGFLGFGAQSRAQSWSGRSRGFWVLGPRAARPREDDRFRSLVAFSAGMAWLTAA